MPDNDATSSYSQAQNARRVAHSAQVHASDFDLTYRECVSPRLERRVSRLAVGVAEGRFGYADALNSLCRYAVRMGGVHLTDFLGLEEYLAGRLADLVVELDP